MTSGHLRVLIVEDSEDLRELWQIWLTVWGFQVETACNGAEGLGRARARPPDLVLMDVWMPVMNGLEAAVQLRQDPRTASVPIIALTALDGNQIEAETKAAGCNAFIRKPVTPEVLLQHIQAILKDPGALPRDRSTPR